MKQPELEQAPKNKKVKLKPLKQNKQTKQSLVTFPRFQALIYQKTDTIKLTLHDGKKVPIQTDISFIKSVDGICSRQLDVIKDFMKSKDNTLTVQECQQIHSVAKLHSQANTINRNSHKTKQVLQSESGLNSLLCKCGCERFKGKKFPVCYDIQQINVLGSGILLFFLLMKYVTYAILSFVLIYSIYALIINFMGNYVKQINNISSCANSYCFFRDQASLYNRNINENFTTILSFVGLFAMIIWGFIIRFALQYGRFKNKAIDKNLTSASDYALKINNLPYQQYNEQQLLEYLQKIAKKAIKLTKQKKLTQGNNKEIDNFDYQGEQDESQEEGQSGKKNDFLTLFIGNVTQAAEDFLPEIKSIQIIYNMQFSRKMIVKIEDLSAEIHKMLNKKENKYFVENKQKYLLLKHQLIQTYEVFTDLRKKFLNDSNFRKKIATRTALIEFRSKKAKNVILRQFSSNKITIFKALKQRMKACIFGQEGTELIFKGQIPQFMRAPQPSDIIWQNCEKKESIFRMLFIYVITFVIILVSFGLIVAVQYYSRQYLGLNNTQSSNKNLSPSQSTLNTVLNIVTAIILQIINKVLWFAMFYLLNLEYNHTNTSKIVSQMGKTLFAMCINIIILPIIVNYGFGKSIYGAAGLSGIVFDYHISAVTINLILQLINPVFIILKFCLYVKCLRYKIIKLLYHKQKIDDDLTNQTYLKKIYSLYQGMEFDIAQSYVFITSNIFHAVFFCELQPFILILLLVEAFLFYWISKIKILKFCKIPLLLQILIFQVAIYQLMLVPIFYGTGGIFISYVRNALDPTYPFQYIAFIISIAIGLLNYFNPQNIMKKIVVCLYQCISCLSPQSVISLTRKTSNEKKESEIIQFKEKVVKQKRQQNYYKQSNSIALLGFQKKLLGQLNFNEIQQQLKTYCQSHLPQNKSKDIIASKNLLNFEQISVNNQKPSFFDRSNQDFM